MNLKEKAIAKGVSRSDLLDVVMIESLIKGDLNAFGDLYAKYYKVVFKKLLMLFNNKEKAEDLASEVILKVKDNAEKFNVESGSGRVEGWIKTIAHNAFLDLKRKEKNNGSFLFLDKDEVVFELKEENQNPEQLLIENEILNSKDKKIEKALSNLKDIEKQIINLRFVENLSYDEMSEILNIDSSTLRGKWHRLKAKLEKRMK
jgi:RNA polymerase sigma-70 factor (ECF subfamily)